MSEPTPEHLQEIADVLTGHPIGSGYYGTAVGSTEADARYWHAEYEAAEAEARRFAGIVEQVRALADEGIRDGRGQAPSLGRALLAILDAAPEGDEGSRS